MKLVRSGSYKHKGFTTLADTELTQSKRSYIPSPNWRATSGDLYVRFKGVEGQTTYDYDLTLSANELLLLVESAMTGASSDVSVRAQTKAIAAYMREVLAASHNNEAKKA